MIQKLVSCHASGPIPESKPTLKINTEKRRVTLMGQRFDTIRNLYGEHTLALGSPRALIDTVLCPEYFDHPDSYIDQLAWIQGSASSRPIVGSWPYQVGIALENLHTIRQRRLNYWRTVTMDSVSPDAAVEENFNDALLKARAIWNRLKGLDFEYRQADSPEISVFLDAIYNRCMGRQLFTSFYSLFGLAPLGADIGDIVYIFPGGRVPFLLRKWGGDGENTFLFVGECYVQGIMQGEAFDPTKLEEIVIT
jgi:hypothetical protein